MKKTIAMLTLAAQIITPLSSQEIRLEGSNTMLPIAQKVAEEYMKLKPNISITVKGSGSGVGITAIIEGLCDIANSSRSAKQKELDLAAKKGRELKSHIVAMDGLTIIVHPSNPINNITLQQLKDIYTGKIKNWKELNGPNKKIVVVSRESSSGTFEFFNEFVLEKKRVRADAIMLASTQGIVNFVKKTEGAIAYIGIGYLTEGVKPLNLEGVQPTEENVVKNKYKLARPLYMYTLKNAPSYVEEFVNFVKSKEASNLIREVGYIPLR